MSSDLIDQLNAVAIKLEECAASLQDLIGKKKSKNKHYVGIITEATLSQQEFNVSSFWYFFT